MVAQRPLWTTYAMLLTVAVTWGAAWPVGRALALAAPPWSAMALRYCLAVPLLFVWLHFAEGVRVPPRSTLCTKRPMFFSSNDSIMSA